MPGSTPRRINLKDEAMLPEATDALWQVILVDDDQSTFPPAFWLVAAHGGAGCSMLSEMLAPAGDAGSVWPVFDENRFCVVVARSTMRGLERAHQVILQGLHAIDAVTIIGAIIVADAAGKIPKALLNKLEVIEKLVPVWHVPYLSTLRIVEEGTLAAWNPRDKVDDSRKTRKIPPTQVCPPDIASVGQELFEAAKAVHHRQVSRSQTVANDAVTDVKVEGED